MKEVITVEKIKAIVAQYIEFAEKEPAGATDWADIFIEPELFVSHDVTLEFIKTTEKDEFEAVADYFFELVSKFHSEELLAAIKAQYIKLYGDNTDTEIYRVDIACLERALT